VKESSSKLVNGVSFYEVRQSTSMQASAVSCQVAIAFGESSLVMADQPTVVQSRGVSAGRGGVSAGSITTANRIKGLYLAK
jgi:hypothetical protein